VQQP